MLKLLPAFLLALLRHESVKNTTIKLDAIYFIDQILTTLLPTPDVRRIKYTAILYSVKHDEIILPDISTIQVQYRR